MADQVTRRVSVFKIGLELTVSRVNYPGHFPARLGVPGMGFLAALAPQQRRQGLNPNTDKVPFDNDQTKSIIVSLTYSYREQRDVA